MNPARNNKRLVLLFHGGLVAFLFIHNFLIPLVRNIGRNSFPLNDMHFWFLSQFVLLAWFFHYDFVTKGKTLIPLLVGSHVIGVLIGVAHFLNLLLEKKTFATEHFSLSLSFLGQGIFFILYYVYFKDQFSNRYPWEKGISGWGLSLILGLSLFLTENVLSTRLTHSGALSDPNLKKEMATGTGKENSCRGGDPSRMEKLFQRGNISLVYDDCGLEPLFLQIHPQENHGLFILNKSPLRDKIRLEKMMGGKWYPKKIIPLLPYQHLSMDRVEFFEEGTYRLRSGLYQGRGMVMIESKK